MSYAQYFISNSPRLLSARHRRWRSFRRRIGSHPIGPSVELSSRARESHPHALPDPYVSLSAHTAPGVDDPGRRARFAPRRFAGLQQQLKIDLLEHAAVSPIVEITLHGTLLHGSAVVAGEGLIGPG